MNRFLHGMVRAVSEAFALPDPILEIGSYQVEGQEQIAELRRFFPDREYLGVDVREGRGVDRVENVEDLNLPDAYFGTVLALNTFEHVARFWRGFEEVHRVLRPDGALLVCCPFYFHIHEYPTDYWRFTPTALELLLEPYPSKLIGWQGPETRPASVWALAFREEHPPITDEEYRRYCHLMDAHAREPLPWLRRLRYQIGRVLCGRRPFAPYLDRQCWESRCVNTPKPLPEPLLVPRAPERERIRECC
jgi:SAM-dependent methyltransferase